MEFRGFRARWFLEYYCNGKWQLSPSYADGTWEFAVTFCARVNRNGKMHSKYRVSSVALQIEDGWLCPGCSARLFIRGTCPVCYHP